MDGHKVVAFSAAVVTLWGVVRLLINSARSARRGATHARPAIQASTSSLPTPQKTATLPTPPTPATAQASPASVPTLQSPASVPTLQSVPKHIDTQPQRAPQPAQPAPQPTTQPTPPFSPEPSATMHFSHHEPTEARMPETPMPVHLKEKETQPISKQPNKDGRRGSQDKNPESKEDNASSQSKAGAGAKKQNKKPSLEVSSDVHVERIDCETLASWLTKGEKPVLVDVRSDDYKGGHITGAQHLARAQYHTGQEFLEELKPQKSQKIVFYCMYGKNQSPTVAQAFFAACDPAQLLQVYVLHGGFQAWLRYCARADLSMHIAEYDQDLWVIQDGGLTYRADIQDAPEQKAPPSLKDMRMKSTAQLRLSLDENHRFDWVDSNTLALWLASKDKPVIVDVRSEDFKGGHVAGSMHIPFASFTTRLGEVQAALRENTGERQNDIVIYCMHGEEHSPTCAMKFLTRHVNPATKVHVLRGGFQAWLNFCLSHTPMTADRVVEYDAEKWIRQDKLGWVYKSNYSA